LSFAVWIQLVSVYVAVLGAEIVGDKTLYTVGSLAARHRVAPVVVGALAAAAVKMAAAVYLGELLARLPPRVIAIAGAATFAGLALSVWCQRSGPAVTRPIAVGRGWRVVLLAFVALSFTEWADPGQMAAALLSARTKAPVMVLVAAMLAMATKILVAATLGVSLRHRVSDTALRWFTTIVCAIMCAITAFQVEL
jgi:putative Ca2+/H+ antiporter (TMEM165/GDT1 family)